MEFIFVNTANVLSRWKKTTKYRKVEADIMNDMMHITFLPPCKVGSVK